ncbi:MAG: hypothetical protein A2Y62_18085 [Candidatus Fischerbacteria bacterium RBG_13_37_8]|uniref:STAS domain-containing protein n=1 Tax=Candidatus Fischerbacteria bacterium RBG_13_37_8 TaxID=1817863 RepID=A0A1F5VVL4_9BACT|nr:MAG: hypothetical protein A2Y62_18085 [Candidatus Fischerbacteria bacterium RBG_13_37_8]
MNIEIINKGSYDVLKIIGAIKMGESKDIFVRSLKKELDKKAHCLMIDFSEVNYIDSNGIGELVGYLEKFKELGSQLILLQPQKRIRDLLQITRLNTIFPIFLSEEEAVKELNLPETTE